MADDDNTTSSNTKSDSTTPSLEIQSEKAKVAMANENFPNHSAKQNVSQTDQKQKTAAVAQQSLSAPAGTGSMEKGMYKHFLNPMFSELQKHADESNAILDRINKQMEEERDARIKARNQQHIPEPLKGSGQTLEDVQKQMEDMIMYDNFEEVDNDKKIPARLQKLDDVGKATIMSHDLAAYISTLDYPHLKRFVSKITGDCELWMTRLFRFGEGSLTYHEDERDGLVRMCKLALHQKYPKYATEGFEALYSRPPVIYLSAASQIGLGHYICSQLGLPMSCLCTVPCNTMFGQSQKMDVAVLEKLIQDDIAAAKTPVLMVAYAGTPQIGHVDNFERLQDICKKNGIWLHVEGDHLATLVMFSVPTIVGPAKSGDSMTVKLGKWLGIPGLPSATLYKKPDPALEHAVCLNTFNPQLKLSCLPLWVSLQSLGHDGILERVKAACKLSEDLYELIKDLKTVKYVSKGPQKKKKEDDELSVRGLISKAINFILIFEIVSPTIVFRYMKAEEDKDGEPVAPYAITDEDKSEEEKLRCYYDALNTWLGEMLQSEVPTLNVDVLEVEKEGVCLRFAPLESSRALGTKKEDIVKFVECLRTQMSILDATVEHRDRFQTMVNDQHNLFLVDMPNWAGLGAVQYIPEMWLEKLGNLTEIGKKDINNINFEMVSKLKATDTAFSLGETGEGLYCVRFGLVTADTEVEELLSMVYSVGQEVEESSKYLEHMSEIILRSIEETNKELQKENENKLVQEGVLRQMPLVGSLINWWSPPPKDALKGRTFNMQSGKIESTEMTYKYHMQIQEQADGTSSGGPKSSTRFKRSSGSMSSVGSEVTATSAGSPPKTTSPKPFNPPTVYVPKSGAAETSNTTHSSQSEHAPVTATPIIPSTGSEQTADNPQSPSPSVEPSKPSSSNPDVIELAQEASAHIEEAAS